MRTVLAGVVIVLTALVPFPGAEGPAIAVQAGGPVHFDIRAVPRQHVSPARSQVAALNAMRGVRVRWNATYGVPASLVRHGGYLSGPGTDPHAFLRAHAELLGLSHRDLDQLVVVQSYVTAHNGARHVLLQQFDGPRVVHGSLVKLTLDREGRVVIMTGSYFPGASAADAPALGAEQALAGALAGQRAEFSSAPAELVTFPMPGGEKARLAWRTTIRTPGGPHEVVVDAGSGELLFRSDHRSYAPPDGRVFTVQHPDLGSRELVSFAGAPFDNTGWVTVRTTTGNNAIAYEDADNLDAIGYQPQTPPSGDPAYQHFDFPFADAFRNSGGTDIATDRDAAIVQAFYWINFLHDYFYVLGFDEPAGNFQDDNFGRGGLGGDAMLVEVRNGFNLGNPENSNTQNPPGERPRMELNAMPWSLADGAFDADLIAHEYTHGVANRLIMGEIVGGGLPHGVQTWALGEGWSDFFGTSIFDDPIAGEYGCNNPEHGCPSYRYDQSPLVYSQLCTLHGDPPCEPHKDGEIWTTALWDLRAALGKAYTEQLVIDGIKNTTPAQATYLDARDAILAADVATSGGANQCTIWRVFAGREMGATASTENEQTTVHPATDVPASCTPTADAGGPYTTPEGTDADLDASASTSGSDPSAGSLTYAWDLDNDGEFDDAVGPATAFTAVGRDGVFTVRLRVTTAAGTSDTAVSQVTVTNVTPAVTLNPIASIVEGGAITLGGVGSDAGWLDPLTATVNWDDGTGAHALAGSLEHVRPDATLAFAAAHTYGDNGAYLVSVCVSDDDSTTCQTTPALVGNVSPTADIGSSGQTSYGGVSAYVIHAGGEIAVEATSRDPGSDDLTLTWDWDSGPDTVVSSLVNPPAADPAKSPSVQPRDVTLSRSHVYGDACLYNLTFRSRDDDGGSGSDQAVVVVVGNADRMRGSGWWLAQYRPGKPNVFSQQTLGCYLDIAVALSTVFETALGREDAAAILFPQKNRGSAQVLFDEQLLAVWLNFANGAVALDDLVDTDGDGTPETAFGAVVLAAEQVRTDPLATREQLLAQKDILERIASGARHAPEEQ